MRLGSLWDHPWLVGDLETPGKRIARRTRWMSWIAVLVANLVGAGVVLTFALPETQGFSQGQVFGFSLLLFVTLFGALAGLIVVILDRVARFGEQFQHAVAQRDGRLGVLDHEAGLRRREDHAGAPMRRMSMVRRKAESDHRLLDIVAGAFLYAAAQ